MQWLKSRNKEMMHFIPTTLIAVQFKAYYSHLNQHLVS